MGALRGGEEGVKASVMEVSEAAFTALSYNSLLPNVSIVNQPWEVKIVMKGVLWGLERGASQ